MRQQKIRGHKRRHRQIESWRLENLELRMDLINKYSSDYIDILVHPWCDISIINSKFPEPKRKTKQLILNALIDIHDSWKNQLDKIGQPYYLKIWLYNPRFSKSQVVCAIGDKINHYENLFYKCADTKEILTSNFGALKNRLEKFNWEHYFDENHYANNEVGEHELYATHKDFEERKNWFKRILKKPHRTTKIDEDTELYSFRQGDIWVNVQKKNAL